MSALQRSPFEWGFHVVASVSNLLFFSFSAFDHTVSRQLAEPSLCAYRGVVFEIATISIGSCTFVDADYACQLRALIEDWRAEFINSPPDAPFLVNGAYCSMGALHLSAKILRICDARVSHTRPHIFHSRAQSWEGYKTHSGQCYGRRCTKQSRT